MQAVSIRFLALNSSVVEGGVGHSYGYTELGLESTTRVLCHGSQIYTGMHVIYISIRSHRYMGMSEEESVHLLERRSRNNLKLLIVEKAVISMS